MHKYFFQIGKLYFGCLMRTLTRLMFWSYPPFKLNGVRTTGPSIITINVEDHLD